MPCRIWFSILALVAWGCGGGSDGPSGTNGAGAAGSSGSSGSGGAGLAPVHGWSRAFNVSSLFTDQGPAAATDASGNVYLTGAIHGMLGDFGGEILTNNVEIYDDVFLASLAPDGTHRWSRRFGGATSECGESIAVGLDGNVYITGQVGKEGVDFGGGPLPAKGAFVASFTPDGEHRWSQAFSQSDSAGEGFGIAVGTQGDVYITGKFWGPVDFGGGPLPFFGPTPDKWDVFLASFTTDGSYRWALGFGDEEASIGRAVAANGDHVVITGSFRGTLDFGGGILVAPDTPTAVMIDMFVAGFTADGVHRFSAAYDSVTGAGHDEGRAVAVDGAGTAYVAGTIGLISGTAIDFGGGPIFQSGGGDSFVVAFSPEGEHLWSHAFGESGFESAFDLKIDDQGNLLCAAQFSRETFVGSLDAADGLLRWTYAAPEGIPDGTGVAAAPGGRIYVTGQFHDIVDFGGGPFMSIPDDNRAFLLQLLEPNGGSP